MKNSYTLADIEAIIYDICLMAAIEMGDDLKNLSWFSKNWRPSECF